MSRAHRNIEGWISIMAVAVALGLAGCADDLGSSAATAPEPPHTSAPDVTPPLPRHDLFCIDRTGSLPTWFSRRVLGHAADVISAAVAGPAGRATFYLRSTSSASYSPDAEIATVVLPAVPAPPSPPKDSPNPFLTQQDNLRRAIYDEQHAAWSRRVGQIRAFAESEADRVRVISLWTDNAGTDVLGCPLRAADLLGRDGERHLFIASDLIPSGPQQDVPLPDGSLTGVECSVAFYCADSAGQCAQRIGEFTDVLHRAGATDVTVVDPQQLGH